MRDLRITSFMPHMHQQGKSFRFDHVTARGERRTVLDVPRYDFNWQLAYDLKDPLEVRAGERIDVQALFDDSAKNFANPAPGRAVRRGPKTDNEMLIGFVDCVLASEDPTLAPDDPLFVVLEPRIQRHLEGIADKNGGVVPRTEIPRSSRESFDKLDFNGDGKLVAVELTTVGE